MSELQCKYESPVRKRGPKFRVGHASQLQVQIQAQPQVHVHVPAQGQGQSQIQIGNESWSASNSPRSELFPITPESGSTTPNGRLKEAILIHNQLLSTIRTLCPDTSLAELTSKCIDSFMLYGLPLVPLVHEPSLRANQSFSVPLIPAALNSTSSPLSSPPIVANDDGRTESQDYLHMKSFAILAAVCGSAITKCPTPSFTRDAELATAFVTASRKMLALYYHEDIKNPDSSSIILRLSHSANAHASGETRLSWLILGEANRLAQDMNLHDEASLYGLDPVEAQLRRNIFWRLFTADKSAAILNDRPFTFTEFNMNSKISVSNQTWGSTSLMDTDSPNYSREFDLCIRIGFNICQELWNSAANLLLELRLVHRRSSPLQGEPLSEAQISCLTGAYVNFMSVLDKAPPWLQNPGLGIPQESSTLPSNAVRDQVRCFWAQHVNLTRYIPLPKTYSTTKVHGMSHGILTRSERATDHACIQENRDCPRDVKGDPDCPV
jgi:hypothetical protein